MKLTKKVLLCVLLGATCVVGSARADSIVFSDLGTGSTLYSVPFSYGISASGAVGNPAFAFTPVASYDFTQLDIALNYSSGTNSVTVELMSDSGGTPDAVLQSWSVSGLPAVGGCCTLQILPGTGTIPLLAGTAYWVAVLPGGSDTLAGWNQSFPPEIGPAAVNFGAGWANTGLPGISGAFEVQGTSSSPEPGTMFLVVAGLFGIRHHAKRKARIGAIGF